MSEELYINLKKVYNSLFEEQQELQEKLNNNRIRISNTNNFFEQKEIKNKNQEYLNKLDIISFRIKTMSSMFQIFEDYLCESEKNNDKEIINDKLQILDIQEKERQRIARDLHDTSLQNLAHLLHKIELSSKYIDEDPIKAKLELAMVNKSLKLTIQEMRNTIFDLRPMTFDDLGLRESFEGLIDRLKESSDFDIEYEIEDINCNNSLVLMTIFRIVEECMNNAVKHSNGSRVYFKIGKEINNCIIVIKDNGQSFDFQKVVDTEKRHFGLEILRERVELLSGIIEINSDPGVGTTIKVEIPLTEERR